MGTIRVFVHGLESSSQGTKGTYFRKRYPDMIIEDYPGSLEDRMTKLRRILSDKRDIVLVGSSYGGLMAAMYACDNEHQIKRLILLAPALNLEEFNPYLNREIGVPVMLYHGSRDDVVPLKPVHGIASKVFQNLSHHIVNDDHPLSETFTSFGWDNLLGD
ncbi:MAG: alpha/beta fold hydrolase [Deltaproteobacteria bacterium]|nr:alpha/beta fold hydrolase [Deltaproteobacteria bacterium]